MEHHVALCVGGTYTKAGAVVVSTLSRHVAPDESLVVWVFHSGMRHDERLLYQKATERDGGRTRVRLLPLPHDITSLEVESDYITSETFGRLALPRLLPESVSRVLYLDADVLIMNSVSELFSLKMRGALIAGVREASDPFLWSRNGLEHVFDIDLDPWLPYFNAGVLLMDVNGLREADAEARCLQYVQRHRPARMDQDALNAILHDRFLELPSVWNVENYYFKTEARRKRYAQLLENARILHFVGHKKPWTEPAVWKSQEWLTELRDLEQACGPPVRTDDAPPNAKGPMS